MKFSYSRNKHLTEFKETKDAVINNVVKSVPKIEKKDTSKQVILGWFL